MNGAAVAGAAPLEWTPQAFARSYEVEIYKNNDVAFSPANRVANARVANPAYTPSEPLPASPVPYVWRVRRNDSKGNLGPWSSGVVRLARQRARAPGTSAGVWVRSTGAYLEWSDVPGATSYQLSLRNGTNNATTSTVATAFAPSELQSGDYTWSVTALDAGGKALGTSAVRNFRVDSVRTHSGSDEANRLGHAQERLRRHIQREGQGRQQEDDEALRQGQEEAAQSKGRRQGSQGQAQALGEAQEAQDYTIKLKDTAIKDVAGNQLVKPAKWSVVVN